jgi:hypothetical protein
MLGSGVEEFQYNRGKEICLVRGERHEAEIACGKRGES